MSWESQTATIHVEEFDETGNVNTDILPAIESSVFFTDKKKYNIDSANALFLYNLAPGTTCYMRNLKVCKGGDKEYCPSKN